MICGDKFHWVCKPLQFPIHQISLSTTLRFRLVGDTSSGRLFASPRESQPTVRIAKEGSAVIKELKAAFEFCADWSWGRKFHSGPRSLSPEELNERGSHRARGT